MFDEETAILRSSSPGSAELLQESVKRWLALIIWMVTLVPTILAALRVPFPAYFGIGLAVWARYGLTIIFIQAGVRLAIHMVIRWMRKADAEKLQSGSVESGSVDLASHLEAVAYPLTMIITTVAFAGIWYMVYPMGCPVIDVPPVDNGGEAMSIPIVSEETAAASILVQSLSGNSSMSAMFARVLGNMCIYQFITDFIICSLIINFFLILEIIVMRVGQWKFLRSNFQDRILESRYKTYVLESLRNRVSPMGLAEPGHLATAHGLPISFPFVLPFEVPVFDKLLSLLNDGILDAGPTSFDRMIMGRPLTYLEYKRKLTGWVERHGLDEAVDFVARTVPQSDGDAKAIAKDLFGRLCSADRDYIIPNDFLSIFQGRAALRDAYGIFDRDQDGTVTKTEFRHTCIMVYREMRNLAISVLHAGDAFRKLADSVHLLVVLGLTFVCLAVFGVHVQSLFAVALSLILGLNVLIGDVAKRSFQGIVFLFVDHPYDVGDRVLVSSLSEADPLQVHRINMLTTVFHRWNGQEVYAPNANLAMATIYNISRSAEQWERIDFQVALEEDKAGPQTDKIALFRDRLEAFLKTRGADYVAAYELKPVIAGEIGRAEQHLDQLRMTLRVQCRPTMDSQKRWSRHSKLLSFVRTTLPACNLSLVGLKSID